MTEKEIANKAIGIAIDVH